MSLGLELTHPDTQHTWRIVAADEIKHTWILSNVTAHSSPETYTTREINATFGVDIEQPGGSPNDDRERTLSDYIAASHRDRAVLAAPTTRTVDAATPEEVLGGKLPAGYESPERHTARQIVADPARLADWKVSPGRYAPQVSAEVCNVLAERSQ